jgi:hypothetical protein
MAAMKKTAPRRVLTALGLALGCGDSPPSELGTETHPAAPLLAMIDDDGDGLISRLEFGWVADDPDGFEAADVDGDGAIGLGELTGMLWRVNPSYPKMVPEGDPDQSNWAAWAEHAARCGLPWGSDE